MHRAGSDLLCIANPSIQLANALSKAFVEILSKHPVNIERQEQGKRMANIVLLRGCGVAPDVRRNPPAPSRV